MRLSTREEAQLIDAQAQTKYGLSGESLMEAAGSLMASHLMTQYFLELKQGEIIFLCGPGNNGGDALVIARHLRRKGVGRLRVIVTAFPGKGSELNQLQAQRLKSQNIPLIQFCETSTSSQLLDFSKASIIIDGLFGVGLTRKVEGLYKALIEVANSSKAPIVSLDIASGLDASQGQVLGVAIRAEETLCVSSYKPGQWVQEGPAHSGRLRLIPIGFPLELVRQKARTHFLFTRSLAKRYLPRRSDLGNKSTYGKLLVAAGHPGTLGAGLLTAKSALRMGAGYVTLTNENPTEALSELPEILTAELDDVDFSKNSYTAVAAGPGFGKGQAQKDWIERLVQSDLEKVVLDADALSLCQSLGLFPLNRNWVITPHAGELSRLIGWDSKEIEANRFAAVSEATKRLGCIVVLKGFRTVIGRGARCWVIETGNGALAKAGSGDVLTGFVGGLLAQGVSPMVASATAAYLHGRLADDWVAWGKEPASLTPSDLIEKLPDLITQLKRSQ